MNLLLQVDFIASTTRLQVWNIYVISTGGLLLPQGTRQVHVVKSCSGTREHIRDGPEHKLGPPSHAIVL